MLGPCARPTAAPRPSCNGPEQHHAHPQAVNLTHCSTENRNLEASEPGRGGYVSVAPENWPAELFPFHFLFSFLVCMRVWFCVPSHKHDPIRTGFAPLDWGGAGCLPVGPRWVGAAGARFPDCPIQTPARIGAW
jgi:hypothetical protein